MLALTTAIAESRAGTNLLRAQHREARGMEEAVVADSQQPVEPQSITGALPKGKKPTRAWLAGYQKVQEFRARRERARAESQSERNHGPQVSGDARQPPAVMSNGSPPSKAWLAGYHRFKARQGQASMGSSTAAGMDTTTPPTGRMPGMEEAETISKPTHRKATVTAAQDEGSGRSKAEDANLQHASLSPQHSWQISALQSVSQGMQPSEEALQPAAPMQGDGREAGALARSQSVRSFVSESSQTTPRGTGLDSAAQDAAQALGPAEVALLFENLRMREERQQLRDELASISERLAALESASKAWGPSMRKGRSRSAPRRTGPGVAVALASSQTLDPIAESSAGDGQQGKQARPHSTEGRQRLKSPASRGSRQQSLKSPHSNAKRFLSPERVPSRASQLSGRKTPNRSGFGWVRWMLPSQAPTDSREALQHTERPEA
ncbi:hypothetical protein WJX73_002222 [Symbiochloris irregularis]|uniref:Uncharacterized protein n=1 Tax=Symbiochloris irregularis TaxID=706552 RepID=A0AAW1PKB4_9CHLO